MSLPHPARGLVDLATSPPLSTQPLLSSLSLSLLYGSASSSGGIQPHRHLLLPSLIPLCLSEAGAHGKGRLRRGAAEVEAELRRLVVDGHDSDVSFDEFITSTATSDLRVTPGSMYPARGRLNKRRATHLEHGAEASNGVSMS